MTNEEYLKSLQSALKDSNGKNDKSTFCKRAAALFLATILVVAGASLITSSSKKSAYNDFVKGKTVSYENLNYENTFSLWNDKINGNDINLLLTGGNYIEKDGILLSGVPVHKDNENWQVLDGATYINKYGECLYYRNVKDRCIYKYDLNNKSSKKIVEGNIGQLQIANDALFFIDYAKNNKIFFINMKQEEIAVKPVNMQAKKFVVCGDAIIALSVNNELTYGKDGNNSATKLTGHVERFYINGDIIVESGNSIVAFDTMGNNARAIYKSKSKNMRLVGINNNIMYVLEDGILSMLENDKKTNLSSKNIRRVQSISASKGDGKVRGVVWFEDNQKPQLVTFEK